jgi:hypothetical protein
LLKSSKIKKRRCAMALVLEVSFALWIMIGCAISEVVQVAGYLN